MSDTVIVLEAEQDQGPNYVAVVGAGLLAKSGFNSAAIGLVTNALVTDQDRGQPGVPYHVIYMDFPDDQGTFAHTNHYTNTAFNLKDVALWDGPSSPFRLHRMQKLLKRCQRKLTPGQLQEFFGDHHIYQSAI